MEHASHLSSQARALYNTYHIKKKKSTVFAGKEHYSLLTEGRLFKINITAENSPIQAKLILKVTAKIMQVAAIT